MNTMKKYFEILIHTILIAIMLFCAVYFWKITLCLMALGLLAFAGIVLNYWLYQRDN